MSLYLTRTGGTVRGKVPFTLLYPSVVVSNAARAAYATDERKVYPDHMDEFYDMPLSVDNGCVHVNSSITNHAAYLIGQEIGIEALGKIFYRALTVYLTPTSNFSDPRVAAVAVCH